MNGAVLEKEREVMMIPLLLLLFERYPLAFRVVASHVSSVFLDVDGFCRCGSFRLLTLVLFSIILLLFLG